MIWQAALQDCPTSSFSAIVTFAPSRLKIDSFKQQKEKTGLEFVGLSPWSTVCIQTTPPAPGLVPANGHRHLLVLHQLQPPTTWTLSNLGMTWSYRAVIPSYHLAKRQVRQCAKYCKMLLRRPTSYFINGMHPHKRDTENLWHNYKPWGKNQSAELRHLSLQTRYVGGMPLPFEGSHLGPPSGNEAKTSWSGHPTDAALRRATSVSEQNVVNLFLTSVIHLCITSN